MYRGKNYLTKQEDWRLEVNSSLYLESLEKLPYNSIDELENDWYKGYIGDNSYNYEDKRDLTQTMEWNLYIRKNPKGRGYNYAVAIYLHNWWDVRGNYSLAWVYKTNINCFRYLVRLCDGFHISRYYNNSRDFKVQEIKDFIKDEL